MSTVNYRAVPARLAVLGFAVLALAVGAGFAARADDSGAITRAAADSAAGGAQTYAHICQGCHMPEGLGAVGAGHYPKLAGNTALVSWQYVALTVLNGKNGMPAFGAAADQSFFDSPHLSDAQIADVVNYVRSHFGNQWKDMATSAQVAALPHPQ
jgi:mono/diheme cytochrome c family protein